MDRPCQFVEKPLFRVALHGRRIVVDGDVGLLGHLRGEVYMLAGGPILPRRPAAVSRHLLQGEQREVRLKFLQRDVLLNFVGERGQQGGRHTRQQQDRGGAGK